MSTSSVICMHKICQIKGQHYTNRHNTNTTSFLDFREVYIRVDCS